LKNQSKFHIKSHVIHDVIGAHDTKIISSIILKISGIIKE